MKKLRLRSFSLIIAGGLLISTALTGCSFQGDQHKPPMTLFIGLDTSGSFVNSPFYADSIKFLANYIYGHLHELGGLAKPREIFVTSIGGKAMDDPKTFHQIHDFEGRSVSEIEEDLKRWFPQGDPITDFNAFFEKAARLTKERNLVLTPISLVVVSDGIPDIPGVSPKASAKTLYGKINLESLDFLARNITVRLIYASPKVGDNWRKFVPRERVRLMTVDADIMVGWKRQYQQDLDPAKQAKLWKWVEDTVDLRVRTAKI